jgi:hypothetical protein
MSSVSRTYPQPNFNVGVSAGVEIDNGYWRSTTEVGGEISISGQTSSGGSATITGDVYDCLVMGGGAGTGRLHVPVHLRGVVTVNWAVGGGYVGAPGTKFAGATFLLDCAPSLGFQLVPCDDPSLTFDAAPLLQTIDENVELVFSFAFGSPIEFHYGPRLSAGLGYAANGSDGTLVGEARIDLDGSLGPAYVTDDFGTVIPDATISAESGFDYLHPVPEPLATAEAALLALGALRRQRVRPSR